MEEKRENTQKKAAQKIKLGTKSPHAAYFMPMLESFAEKGTLNEVTKSRVVKSCDLLDLGIPLFPNDFRKEHDAGSVRADNAAQYAGAGADFLVTTWPYFGRPADIKMHIEGEPARKADGGL